QDKSVEHQLSSLARRLHATLVVGVTETISQTAFRNEVVAFGPDGRLVDRYEKVHRVPFGEYVPFRGFFSHLANLSAVPRDAVPGTGDGVLHTPAGELGTMVSYEVFFSDRGRTATRNGANLLIVPTNTSSYSTGQVPAQEIAAARLQAIAQGRDLLQAAPTGYSALIENSGRVLARTSLGTRAVLVGNLRLRDGETLYVAWGDVPVLVVSLVMLLAGWGISLLRRDERKPYFYS
ncbi:MAG TPA: apolipoprotein N-acyltransferase, partial [Acidimicrobiales bacterium]|nr:apolipoprotein N-acyltransferase [Acidimicrobiales bacterium]